MRKLLMLVAVVALAFGIAAQANAAVVKWSGSLKVELGTLPPVVSTGTGLATVNGSGGGSHLDTLQFDGGIVGNGTVPVTDPDVTAVGITEVRVIDAGMGAGTFGPFSGTGNGGPFATSQNTLPLSGSARICLFFEGCDSMFLQIDLMGLSPGGASATVGVGGILTLGRYAGIRVSVINNPWTVGTRAISNIPTDNGGSTTYTAMGFVHGPASGGASSAALTSAVINVITPQEVETLDIPGNNARIALFTRLEIHVIPEPGLMLLLGSGVVGLAVIGRHRMRK